MTDTKGVSVTDTRGVSHFGIKFLRCNLHFVDLRTGRMFASLYARECVEWNRQRQTVQYYEGLCCCCCCCWAETCARSVVVHVMIMTSAVATVMPMTDLAWMSPLICKDQDKRAENWRLNSATRGCHLVSTNRRWLIRAISGCLDVKLKPN